MPSSASINANDLKTDQFSTLRGSDFEDTLPAARFVQLPRDAQIQIDAALNEMEAMDYRDWVIDYQFRKIFTRKIFKTLLFSDSE